MMFTEQMSQNEEDVTIWGWSKKEQEQCGTLESPLAGPDRADNGPGQTEAVLLNEASPAL